MGEGKRGSKMKLSIYEIGTGDKKILSVKAIAVPETMEDKLIIDILEMHPEIETNFEYKREYKNDTLQEL